MDSVVHVFDRLCSYNIFSFLCKCFHSWETSWITQPLEGNDPGRAQRDDQRRVVGEDGGGPTQAKQMIMMPILGIYWHTYSYVHGNLIRFSMAYQSLLHLCICCVSIPLIGQIHWRINWFMGSLAYTLFIRNLFQRGRGELMQGWESKVSGRDSFN